MIYESCQSATWQPLCTPCSICEDYYILKGVLHNLGITRFSPSLNFPLDFSPGHRYCYNRILPLGLSLIRAFSISLANSLFPGTHSYLFSGQASATPLSFPWSQSPSNAAEYEARSFRG